MSIKSSVVWTLLTLLAFATAASADIGYFESFETSTDTWFSYQSDLNRVASGTNGIGSYDGDWHMTITDPASPEEGYYPGAFSRLGSYSSTFGSGFISSAAVYIDLADSNVAAGTYGFDLSQAINDTTGEHAQDNIFHVGALDDGSVVLHADHNSGFTNVSTAEKAVATFSESGWYTFEWTFVPSETPDKVDVGFNVYDPAGDLFWNGVGNHEGQYTLSTVGGNRYMWFCYVAADSLAVDAVSQSAAATPEPATFAIWGLLGCLAICTRRRR